MSRDWLAWHEAYDDPTSSLSRRLAVVREALTTALAERTGRVSLLSLCAGDGRDTLPVLAASTVDVSAVLVELDPDLGGTARRDAAALGLDVAVRADDAGLVAVWADAVPVDVLMLCGVLGNITDDDIRRTLEAAPLLLQPGGTLIWTRAGDLGEWVRDLLRGAGWRERLFVEPDDASFRVGVHEWHGNASGILAERLFSFVP
ncbi:MAG: class I SAM-dependent methyltransferase [Nocardioides sp.]